MRRLVPEILDGLSPSDPTALACRRDLGRINSIMGNHRWLARQVVGEVRAGDTIAELGAGDTTLARRILRTVTFPCTYLAIDARPAAPGLTDPRFRWHPGSLPTAFPAEADIVVANLFLHHLSDDDLGELGTHLPRARAVFAREPSRRRPWMRFALYPLRLHSVTRHDMLASIHAGFLGNELARLLGMDTSWDIRCRDTLRGAHSLRARRLPACTEG